MTKHSDKPLFNHEKESYGDSFNAHLLEQYKLYVQSADNVSARRGASNRYMLTLSVAIVALYGVFYTNFDADVSVLALVPVVGIAVSLVWNAIIKSHVALNEIKFKIVHELEDHLPASIYKHERLLTEDGRGETYLEVSTIEASVPWLFVALHVALTAWIIGEDFGFFDLAG
ncbi:MAG: hypothetical protein F4Y88_00520 [Chloroflexi bacterium]|nr:hypothetical protein [Chloroflexota bacterium]